MSPWKYLTSLKITVTCLLMLFILTAWGTYYQSEYGLYAAQNRFFYSFFFLAGGFIPIPGAQLVLWLLSANLLADALLHFKRRIRRPGIFLIHWGIIVLLLGSFVTYYFAEESYLALYEGEAANVSTDYRHWEIATWKVTSTGTNEVFAYPVQNLETGTEVHFQELNVSLKILNYFENARAGNTSLGEVRSFSGLTSLRGVSASYDPAENVPGLIVKLLGTPGGDGKNILLWGNEVGAFHIEQEPSAPSQPTIAIQLRRMRYPLPLSLGLKDFIKKEYPGTDIPKSYESIVWIKDQNVQREVRIYMNHPLRFDDFTFYQASYQIDADGRERTVLAVVKNVGRLVPYIASGIIFAGLILHFLTRLTGSVLLKKTRSKERSRPVPTARPWQVS